jgi:cytochrome c oxidase assembly protein subunit 15
MQSLKWLGLFTTLLILVQLIIAAAMRHQHAGLAIPDFPLAHGKLWPDTGADAIARYNAQRVSINAENPITTFQVELQMAHRVVALAILIGVGAVAWRVRSSGFNRSKPSREWRDGTPNVLRQLAFVWLGLTLAQVGLGAVTIWTNKAADVATAHVLVGALALTIGALWCAIAFRQTSAAVCDRRTEQRRSPGAATIGAQPAVTANK